MKDVLRSVLHEEFVLSEFNAIIPAISGNHGSCVIEKYINKNTVLDVQNVVIEYIDRICGWLLLIATNNIKQEEVGIYTQRSLCFVAGVQRKQIRIGGGRTQRVCSEQGANKITSFVEQLRGIKETILISANNAYNLKNTHLLSTLKQDFDISITNKERKRNND